MNFLRRFHDIVSDQTLDFNSKIKNLLAFGLEVFSLDVAIISKIDANTYTVLHALTPDRHNDSHTVLASAFRGLA
ncbi:hypothetical protein VOI46_17100 (plasmid) [Pseudoalteromonas sp. CuT4-3]|uniref:hypothetical protein n=1 Tax=Pseudoalteromonas sp. CuT4-3 TaxID=3112573 RepID=UPI002D77B94A|nr:hypothetical protein [Pseudoalteromonas sp. CuT 4-3]WRU75110.1 hypothetical protein VOI46_17100 [Pseudoalteromonas sp. CuT 4-3]